MSWKDYCVKTAVVAVVCCVWGAQAAAQITVTGVGSTLFVTLPNGGAECYVYAGNWDNTLGGYPLQILDQNWDVVWEDDIISNYDKIDITGGDGDDIMDASAVDNSAVWSSINVVAFEGKAGDDVMRGSLIDGNNPDRRDEWYGVEPGDTVTNKNNNHDDDTL